MYRNENTMRALLCYSIPNTVKEAAYLRIHKKIEIARQK